MAGVPGSMQQWLADCSRVHGDRFDYSRVVYVDRATRVTIICPDHGEFTQTPSAHIRSRGDRPNYGCAKCGHAVKSDSLQSFINKARVKHNGFYDYSNAVYRSSRENLTITCPDHGCFSQRASKHLEGSGCPQCGASGYFCEGFFKSHPERKADSAMRYVIKLTKDDETFFKVGITTTTLSKRFASDAHALEVLDTKYGSLYECFLDEQALLEKNAEYRYEPTNRLHGGNTECLSQVLL